MRSRHGVTGVLLLTMVVVGCGDADSSGSTVGDGATTTTLATTTTGDSSGPSDKITIADIAFDAPDSVPAGTTLVVENQDNISHTFTSPDDIFDSGTISPGATFEVTLNEPGEYAFFCQFHPDRMMGTITVEP